MLNTLNRCRRTRITVAAIALASTQACYAYVPLAAASAPKAGERVRVVLTPAGSTELARYLGPNVAQAEGELSSMAADGTLVVAVDVVQMMNGVRQPWTGEGVVSFPSEYRAEVHERTFQKGRSIAGGTALAVALVGIAVVALRAARLHPSPSAQLSDPPPWLFARESNTRAVPPPRGPPRRPRKSRDRAAARRRE